MTDDFVTFFGAGQETTGNTLGTAFLELGKHPEIARKAQEEIDQVLAQRNVITYQDVVDLKYCNAIFKETLRLYCPIGSVQREAPEDFYVNELCIPKGSSIFVSYPLYLFFFFFK